MLGTASGICIKSYHVIRTDNIRVMQLINVSTIKYCQCVFYDNTLPVSLLLLHLCSLISNVFHCAGHIDT